MNRKTIIGIIVLMSISLIGIIAVQVFWIKNAVDVKTQQFNRSVNEAMGLVVGRLEKNENMVVLSDQFNQFNHRYNVSFPEIDSIMNYQFIVFDSMEKKLSQINEDNHKLDWLEEDYENRTAIYSWIDSLGSHMEVNISIPDDEMKKQIKIIGEQELIEFENEDMYFISDDLDTSELIVRAESKIHLKTIELNDMINQMVVEVESFSAPISQRLSPKYLGSLIKKELTNSGILLPFEYAVVSGMGDELLPVKSDNFDTTALNSPFRVNLFPNDIFEKPNFLLLTFPDISSHLYKSIFFLLIGSILFTLIIIITFSVTMWVILKQKKISEIKSDFINNMTHEFKTPIATISLAVDSIDNPKILSLPEKIKYFTGIIRDENRRMNKQVENVLQMAMIDKNDFNLHIRPINIHEFIQRSADHFKLQLEKKNGKIHLDFQAENPVIENDEIHFYNIINNLIDNAIKYSDGSPEIKVKTESTKSGVKISVQDNGIGISKEAQDKIFDKFFRVSTGNVHNIKGFGLGLSYVKALVLTLKGNISVESESRKGSRFYVFLPQQAEH